MKKFWHKVEYGVDKAIVPCLVALMVVIILEIFYQDIAHHYHLEIIITDAIIVTIFLADLVFKYLRLRNVPLFLKRYWLDILAVFPFYLFFRLIEVFLILVPISESFQSFQMMLHEGLEIEKEGSKIVKEASRSSRYARMVKIIRPVLRLPRFLKIIAYYERPTGKHHHYEKKEQEQKVKIKKQKIRTNPKKNKQRLLKKGASPLVATIILFFFGILIGLLIVRFDNQIRQKDTLCDDIHQINLQYRDNKPTICYKPENSSHSSVHLIVENNAEKPVFGLKLSFIGNQSEFYQRDYNTTIYPYGGTVSTRYFFPQSIGGLLELRVSVYRKLGIDLILCSKDSFVISEVPECEN